AIGSTFPLGSVCPAHPAVPNATIADVASAAPPNKTSFRPSMCVLRSGADTRCGGPCFEPHVGGVDHNPLSSCTATGTRNARAVGTTLIALGASESSPTNRCRRPRGRSRHDAVTLHTPSGIAVSIGLRAGFAVGSRERNSSHRNLFETWDGHHDG